MNDKKLGQEPAFPFELIKERVGGAEINWINYKGMSKRFYAACVAMQGLLANPNIKRPSNNVKEQLDIEHVDFAEICFRYADELLKEENINNK